MNSIPPIRKKDEFEAFLGVLREGGAAHWTDIANIVGVDKDTITEWKKRPEAKQIIAEGIQYALQQMEATGKNDWRMWQAKLSMLGISPKSKTDITSDEKAIIGPTIFIPPEIEIDTKPPIELH